MCTGLAISRAERPAKVFKLSISLPGVGGKAQTCRTWRAFWHKSILIISWPGMAFYLGEYTGNGKLVSDVINRVRKAGGKVGFGYSKLTGPPLTDRLEEASLCYG